MSGRFAPTIYQTVAQLGTEPGPQTSERYAYVRDTNATYTWVAGDSNTDDSLNYIAPNGGSQGRWKRIVAAERGANLTDADATIYVSGNRWRVLPDNTLTQNRILTLGTTGAQTGDTISVSSLDITSGYSLTINNGGAGSGTLATLADTGGFLVAEFDGTNWVVRLSSVYTGFTGVAATSPIVNDGTPGAPIINLTESALQVHKNTAQASVNLTDANVSIAVGDGRWRVMPASTMTDNRTITVANTGAVAGDRITISRQDAGHRRLVIKDGPSSAILYVIVGKGDVSLHFDGTNWVRRESSKRSGDAIVNVVDFGADPLGVTDSTTAIQAALDEFSGLAQTGTIYFPQGEYLISSTLTYIGASGYGITMQGETGLPFVGTKIKWGGSSGGTMFNPQGMNTSVIKDMVFDGNSTALYGIHFQYYGAGSLGSSGNHLENVGFHQIQGIESACVAIGTADDSLQVSEITFKDCIFTGAGSTTYYGVKTLTAGNCKNFRVYGGTFANLRYGFNWQKASGILVINGVNFATCSVSDIAVGTGSAFITACQSEGSGMFLTGTTGSNYGQVALVSNTWAGQSVTTDVCLDYSGIIYLNGNYLQNSRTGSSEFIVTCGELDQASTSPSAITSIGNHYYNSTGHSPIYLSSGTVHALTTEYAATRRNSVLCLGDLGGQGGAIEKLQTVIGGPINQTNGNIFDEFYNGSLVTSSRGGELRRCVNRVTIDYSKIVAASTIYDLDLAFIRPKTRIVSIVADTTAAYAGIAGPITLAVGWGSGGDEILASHTVSGSTTTKGLADADLGTDLVRSAAVQGGFIKSWTARTVLYARWTSASGNFGNGSTSSMSAGSTTFYIITENMD